MNGYTIFFWILMFIPILIGCGYAFWKLFIYYWRVIRGEPVYWDREFWFHPWRHMDYLDRRNYFIGLIIVAFYYTLMSVGLYYSFDYLRESMIQLSWGGVAEIIRYLSIAKFECDFESIFIKLNNLNQCRENSLGILRVI